MNRDALKRGFWAAVSLAILATIGLAWMGTQSDRSDSVTVEESSVEVEEPTEDAETSAEEPDQPPEVDPQTLAFQPAADLDPTILDQPGYLVTLFHDGQYVLDWIRLANGVDAVMGHFPLRPDDPYFQPRVQLAADGLTLFYTDDDFNVWRYDLDPGANNLLRESSKNEKGIDDYSGYELLNVSSNSQNLALRWYGYEIGGVVTMKRDGTASDPVYNAFDADWSPDSQRIALAAGNNFFGGEPAQLRIAPAMVPGGGQDILPRELTSDKGPVPRDVADPAWSPDGKTIAVSYSYQDTGFSGAEQLPHEDELADIYTIRLDGTQFTRITTTNAGARTPLWLDRTTLLYSVTQVDGTSDYGVYQIKTDGSGAELIFRAEERAYELHSLSPDGRSLAVTTRKQDEHGSVTDTWTLVILDLQTKKVIAEYPSGSFAGWTQ